MHMGRGGNRMRMGHGGRMWMPVMMPVMMVFAILMMAAFFCLGPLSGRGVGGFGSLLFFVLCCLCLLGFAMLAALAGFVLMQTETGQELLQNLPSGVQGLLRNVPKRKRGMEDEFEEFES
jgi:hypothetical protein